MRNITSINENMDCALIGDDPALTSANAANLANEAHTSERKRVLKGVRIIGSDGVWRVQLGKDSENQLMKNILNKKTYVQPHKHPLKFEYFSMEENCVGRVKVICFTDTGVVSFVKILTPGKPGEEDASFTIPVGVFHAAVGLEENSQVEEIKPGKFDEKTDKVMAEWAPAEKTPDSVDFQRWLEICEPGQEASRFREHLLVHMKKELAEISAMQAKISETNEKIAASQADILKKQSEAQSNFPQNLEGLDLSSITLNAIPKPQGSTSASCFPGFGSALGFFRAPIKKDSGPSLATTPVNINIGKLTVNVNTTIFTTARRNNTDRTVMEDSQEVAVRTNSEDPGNSSSFCGLLGF